VVCLTIGGREVVVGPLLGEALARGRFGQTALMTVLICGILLLGLWRHQRAASVWFSRATEPGDWVAGLQGRERGGRGVGIERGWWRGENAMSKDGRLLRGTNGLAMRKSHRASRYEKSAMLPTPSNMSCDVLVFSKQAFCLGPLFSLTTKLPLDSELSSWVLYWLCCGKSLFSMLTRLRTFRSIFPASPHSRMLTVSLSACFDTSWTSSCDRIKHELKARSKNHAELLHAHP
jgi:hypothetical protein